MGQLPVVLKVSAVVVAAHIIRLEAREIDLAHTAHVIHSVRNGGCRGRQEKLRYTGCGIPFVDDRSVSAAVAHKTSSEGRLSEGRKDVLEFNSGSERMSTENLREIVGELVGSTVLVAGHVVRRPKRCERSHGDHG